MEIIGYLIFGLIVFSYLFKIMQYYFSWLKSGEIIINEEFPENELFFSVIIAFRNEEANLPSLIAALQSQYYSNFEVILINDHSDDSGEIICNQLIKNDKRFSCFNLPTTFEGKKQAIAFGIESSKYQYIITTDADCLMFPNWLNSLNKCFKQTNAEIILAPVFLSGQSYFQQLQILEFFSLMASTAASALMQKPIMANAANMAFTKKLYLQNREIQHQKFMSGDDMMLLIAAKKQRKNIGFCTNIRAMVTSTAQKNAIDFFKQRMRWTSKSKFYHDFDVNSTALIVLSINILLFFCLMLTFLHIQFLIYYALALFVKSVADILFLRKVALHFNFNIKYSIFFFIQLLYPFYVLISSLGIFIKPKWKGRKI